MRAYIVVLALLATPLAVARSQLPGNSSCDNGNGDENRSDSGSVHAHQGLCAPQPPPPPPSSCGPTVSAPTATVTGSVTKLGTGVSGVCVQVFLGTMVAAGTLTDPTGSYSVGVSPPSTGATFLICLVVPTGSFQSSPLVTSGFPACPSGDAGFSPSLLPGGGASFVNFTL